MSGMDWLASVDTTLTAIGVAGTSVAGLLGMIYRAVRKERGWRAEKVRGDAERVRREDVYAFDDAAGANARLFKNLSDQLAELRTEVAAARAECRECERDKDQLRAEFSAEIKMMDAQYRGRSTAWTLELMFLSGRASGCRHKNSAASADSRLHAG